MARPKLKRSVCCEPEYLHFKPDGINPPEKVILTVDEYETIRLVDFEKKTHWEAAAQMDISRTTVTEIYENARSKISDCLVNGKRLVISGGNYKLCNGQKDCCSKVKHMERYNTVANISQKGADIMRIAVTYENGNIFQHFGKTQAFKFYDVEGDEVKSDEIVETNGRGHGSLVGFLVENKADTLICGGIGGGAQAAIAEAGIKLFGGAVGNTDEAVKALLDGRLVYNPEVHCDHHSHEHAEGGHNCGEHHGNSHNCDGHHGNSHKCGEHHGNSHKCGGHHHN